MKLKVTKIAWYDNKLLDPEKDSNIIIDYVGEKCPSWGEPLEAIKEKTGNGEGEKGNKQKVKDLPEEEKAALLEEAQKVGIVGNQILSWNVETLKAKIEEKTGNGEE
ncbi:MAG: hypothetical protein IKR34_02265 [Candidatus Gastranaerophilales bacterium]|nr:hypothetical protein [Elusimicrobiota bacterium]MBR6298048.1 hypothetical protein [Candidatus Gastranaerophilales bacterium]